MRRRGRCPADRPAGAGDRDSDVAQAARILVLLDEQMSVGRVVDVAPRRSIFQRDDVEVVDRVHLRLTVRGLPRDLLADRARVLDIRLIEAGLRHLARRHMRRRFDGFVERSRIGAMRREVRPRLGSHPSAATAHVVCLTRKSVESIAGIPREEHPLPARARRAGEGAAQSVKPGPPIAWRRFLSSTRNAFAIAPSTTR